MNHKSQNPASGIADYSPMIAINSFKKTERFQCFVSFTPMAPEAGYEIKILIKQIAEAEFLSQYLISSLIFQFNILA